MSVFPTQEAELFGSNLDRLVIGLGIETETIQRSVFKQIYKNLPSMTKKLQFAWDQRDKTFSEEIERNFAPIKIPSVEKKNFFTGGKNEVSQLEAALDVWPRIEIHCGNSKPSSTLFPDQYGQNDINIYVEVYCNEGPVSESELHTGEGFEKMQILDSKLQRLTDAVHLSIAEDYSLGSVLANPIQKTPIVSQSRPWARKENNNATGEFYIFQAKQLQYTVQKNSY